jgi:MSHA biogenesis protein MshP
MFPKDSLKSQVSSLKLTERCLQPENSKLVTRSPRSFDLGGEGASGSKLETSNFKLETGFAQRGLSLVTAIFLMVVLALLGAFMLSVTGIQQSSQQLDVQGVRAYQAARAGIEWGAFQVLDPNHTLNPATCSPLNWPATCAASTPLTSLAGSLSPFTVTVTCAVTSATEGNRELRVYQLVATACNQPTSGNCPNTGTPTAGYVERQLQATLSKCKDPTATAPRCECG